MALRETIVVMLTPTHLRVGVLQGRTARAVERSVLDEGALEKALAEGLAPLDATLKELLKKAGVARGSRVHVVYAAEGAIGECVTVEGGAGAEERACGQVRGSLPQGGTGWVLRGRVVSDEAPRDGKPGRAQVVVAADRNGQLEKLAMFVRRAGLRVASVHPIRARLLAAAAARALARNDGKPLIVADVSGSVVACASAGALSFVRPIDVGLSQIADAFVRTMGAAGEGGVMTSSLSRARAHAILFESGIPGRGALLDAPTGLHGEAALPLIQPVLQRFGVEVRQTLRFAMDEATQARATLVLEGPGALVPALDGAISSQLELAVEKSSGWCDAGECGDPERAGLLLTGLPATSAGALMPVSEQIRAARRSLNTALVAGAAAAGLLIAGLAGFASARLSQVNREIARLGGQFKQMTESRAERAQAAVLSRDLAVAQKAMTGVLGRRAAWSSALGELTRVCGDSVRLTDVSGQFSRDSAASAELTLRGVARAGEHDEDASLRAFLTRLTQSPLVESAQLVSSRLGDDGGEPVRMFELSIKLPTVPVTVAERSADASEEQP